MSYTLLDFVKNGKELELSGADLKEWAETEYEKYVAAEEKKKEVEEKRLIAEEKRLIAEEKREKEKLEAEVKREKEKFEAEEKREKEKFERELRLLERKAALAQNEQTSGVVKQFKQYKFSLFKHETDDVNTFFLSFERQCALYELKRETWPVHLLPLLSGSCRDIFF